MVGDQLLIYYQNTITRLELISEHFSYPEEYVLDHHILWIDRKFKHAERSRYEARYTRQQDDTNSRVYLALLKTNDKQAMKDAQNYLLEPYEKALEKEKQLAEGISKNPDSGEEFVDPRIAFANVFANMQQDDDDTVAES